jgi:xylulose-5-phosphate/fructose-6-phosphate phosphoketolase
LGIGVRVQEINLVYAHLNRVILRDDLAAMLITGPGHGAPANLANLSDYALEKKPVETHRGD